ncbi:MAG: peptide-methionine (S)-S-oxide reductase MsrA [Gammaproteobacteria bacterium]|nr:peptide-methionine (S)-S-oxide reductase MsrA [Gammaproteobacteria bacterium]
MSFRVYPLLSTPFIILTLILTLILSPSQAEENFNSNANTESIILAGGCFWCIESDYEKLDGVIDVVSGYSGRDMKNPTYKQVSAGNSGHIEVVKVTYNPQVIKRARILDHFWRHIDPTRDDGQFCDRGPQYRPAIFYNNESEKQSILKSAAHIENTKPFKEPLKVEFIQARAFYPAEDYHQDYYKKNPVRYNYYRFSCGRDARIEELWGS